MDVYEIDIGGLKVKIYASSTPKSKQSWQKGTNVFARWHYRDFPDDWPDYYPARIISYDESNDTYHLQFEYGYRDKKVKPCDIIAQG